MNKHLLEQLAELLDNSLPPNWRDPLAVAARQDHLAAVAHLLGEATVEAGHAFNQAQQQGQQMTVDAPAVRRFAGELLQALRRYVHETQRGDGRLIITDALASAAGAPIAEMVNGIFDRVLAKMREDYIATAATT